MIGDTIEVKVLSVMGDQIRVGIQAPTEIPIHREEVYWVTVRQNQQATRSTMPSEDLLFRLKK